jgi:hypothetical protein
VNLENADMSKAPIISAGTCVNANIHPIEELEDYIVAWLITGEDEFQEVLISEEMAFETTHPIFIIDNAEEDIFNRTKQVQLNPESRSSNTKNQQTAWYATYEHMIWNRFDNTKKSEFAISAGMIDENGNVYNLLRHSNNTVQHWKVMYDIHKNDQGVWKQIWRQFTIENVIPFEDNYVFWNAYERDWYASPKDVGVAERFGDWVYLVGNMSKSSDVYGFEEPEDVDVNPLAMENIYYNWARWYQDPLVNCRLRFWRIQP